MIRRINLFGGPCSGKSAMAAELFAILKSYHMSVEHVNEFVKLWAYIGRNISGFDQVKIFGNQLNMEETYLKNGIDLVVSDSPIMLNICYTMKNSPHLAGPLLEIANTYENAYRSLNVFITRPEVYHSTGRYENREQAVEMDKFIKKVLSDNGVQYITINCGDIKVLKEHVLDNVK